MADVEVRGARLFVQRLGAPRDGRPPVVFLHGLIMDNLSSWYFTLANPVATETEVVLYDMRGHGRSTRTPSGYRLEDMIGDLDGLLDALGLGRVTLVANSFGGMLAQAYALARPERVASLVLVDAHVADEGWGARMQTTLRLQGAEADRMILTNFASWRGRHSSRKKNRLIENARDLVEGTSLVEDLASFPAFSDDELAAIRCPVLALYGAESEIRAHGERLARLLPDCELVFFDGSTHSILWEKTNELRDALVGWVARPRGPLSDTGS
jgi:pimeloyl-ACP methyl ester carboxylesterase